jgi:hypothetical protein
MSGLPKGTPCYALIWEGSIGAFYEIDQDLNISLIADVLNEPGNRYTSIYGLADSTFPKDAPFSRFSDAGKLMALASFSSRRDLIDGEREVIDFLLSAPHVQLNLYEALESSPYYNVGLEDPEFRNFAGIFSDTIFDTFAEFARRNLRKGLPLIVAGGCGLNCDWNTKWRETGMFSDVFVPPVANDSGSAIGTAIDAQFQLTGDPKILWDVYSGLEFVNEGISDLNEFDVLDSSDALVADMLAHELILAWVTYPARLVEEARHHPEPGGGHVHRDTAEAGGTVWQKLARRGTWLQVAQSFVMDWSMLWKDLLLGFLIAGALSVFVPDGVWQALFIKGANPWIQVPANALLGPLVAVLSFVCSIGNVPMAAVLWGAGVSFGGVLAFLYADLIVLPLLDVYRRYYGWKMAAYIAAVFYATMVVSALIMDVAFSALGWIPQHPPNMQAAMVHVSLNYTFWLNLAFAFLAVVLFVLSRQQPMSPGHCEHHAH